MSQPQLPGMPLNAAIRVTLEYTLYPDGLIDSWVSVSTRDPEDRFSKEVLRQCGYQPLEKADQCIHGTNLLVTHLVRRLAEPFPPFWGDALDEALELYGHLV